MPLYEYRCESCGHQFEVIQKFSDAPITVCPNCHAGPVVKLLSSPAFQFKGSGWYITDYARKEGKGGEEGKGAEEGKRAEGGKGAEEGKRAKEGKGAEEGKRAEAASASTSESPSTTSSTPKTDTSASKS